MSNQQVLIITGSLNDIPKQGLTAAAITHINLAFSEKSKWLSLKIKLTFAETLVAKSLFGRRAMRQVDETCRNYLRYKSEDRQSNLTADTIAHYLTQASITYKHCSLAEIIYSKKFRKNILRQYTYIFLSTTFIHDLNELNQILDILKTQSNKIIIGGALTSSLLSNWQGDPRVKFIAVGYGEYLIPIIAHWILTDEKELLKPGRGSIVAKEHSIFLISGSPETKDLDFIEAPAPLNHKDHEQFDIIYYESVRGCPFRCSFCNYPYLFSDNKFRYKSADKIVDDWIWYKEKFKVKTVVVLDSLFTVPSSRLQGVAERLIHEKANIDWICYARANDLCDIDYLKKLKAAGLRQVQIGLESGNQEILDNMNKKTTVQQNIEAIQNCRRVGIATVVSVIVGFPGETDKTIEDTYKMLEEARPDFCFVVVFSTRVANVPILSPDERARFNLKTQQTSFSMSPYWVHGTMSCLEAGDHARVMNQRLGINNICLDPVLFLEKINHYHPEMREGLLKYQFHILKRNKWLNKIFSLSHRLINSKLRRPLQSL